MASQIAISAQPTDYVLILAIESQILHTPIPPENKFAS